MTTVENCNTPTPTTNTDMDHLPPMQGPPSVTLPVTLVADLQDSLLMVMTDLQRLEGLLDHATGNLLERFGNANRDLAVLEGERGEELTRIRHSLHQAVTELQFHDMATQLLAHTGQTLKGCAWRLAEKAMAPDEDEVPLELEPIPQRPSPVTQNEMDAGSVELF